MSKEIRRSYDLENGKYTIIQTEPYGAIEALRYGEPWREFVGDKFMYNLVEELFTLFDLSALTPEGRAKVKHAVKKAKRKRAKKAKRKALKEDEARRMYEPPTYQHLSSGLGIPTGGSFGPPPASPASSAASAGGQIHVSLSEMGVQPMSVVENAARVRLLAQQARLQQGRA